MKLWKYEVGHPRYQHVEWVNSEIDGDSGLVVINSGDIYYMKSPSESPRTLTRDATENLIYHGIPDILYEGMKL